MTWRLMRSTSGAGDGVEPARVQPPGGAGDVDHQVGAALELVGDAQGHPDEAQVGEGEPGRPMIRRHSSSIAWRSESMASSSATTRSACSRSPSRRASVPDADGVEGQRRQAHDVEAHVVDARTDARVGLVGHDLRGDHVAIMVVTSGGGRSRSARLFPPCSPSRHHDATARPGASVRSAPSTPIQFTFQEEHPHAPFVRSSRRDRARRVGAAGAADRQRRDRHHADPGEARLGHLNGDGSTFQLGFNQVVIGGFKQQQKAVTINYQGNGSGTGRTDFVNGVVDFAGTDAAYKSTDPQPPKPFLYFPTVVAPITVSYNLSGVKLNLSPDTIAKIFSGAITKWNDAAIKSRQPEGEAAEHDDHGRAPQRQLRHHRQLHQLPHQGGAHRRGRSAAARP